MPVTGGAWRSGRDAFVAKLTLRHWADEQDLKCLFVATGCDSSQLPVDAPASVAGGCGRLSVLLMPDFPT